MHRIFLFLLLFASPLLSAELDLVFLDIGQGDAILARSGGKTALIDAGPRGCDLVRMLRARGVVNLDLVVISHHHADHIGEMDEALRTFRPRFFLDSGSPFSTRLYLRLLRTVETVGAQFLRAGARTIALGDAELRVFPLPPADEDNENNNSIGIRLVCGTFSALLTGDSEDTERAWWMAHADPALYRNATVLKLAHHGSHNGTDPAWLDAVNPELAVVSLGAGNRYGHPHPGPTALLGKRNIRLLRTDRDGPIAIRSDGKTYSVSIGKNTLPSPGEPSSRGIDPNTASTEDLQSLPGVGPVLARRIVEGRPYRAVEDLLRVKGIGRATLEKLRPYLEIR